VAVGLQWGGAAPFQSEELRVLVQPPLELFTFPTFWQVGLEDWHRIAECGATKQPHIVVAGLVAIRTVYSPSKAIGKMAEGKGVARV
jgi:hypothetical protein